MNALKHMELIFGAGLALACVLAFLPGALVVRDPVDRDPVHHTKSDVARVGMPVVVVTGKRMTALEKRQSVDAGSGSRPAGTGS
jgi:hypothetical protein